MDCFPSVFRQLWLIWIIIEVFSSPLISQRSEIMLRLTLFSELYNRVCVHKNIALYLISSLFHFTYAFNCRTHGISLADLLFSAEYHWKIGAENFTTSTGLIFSESEQLYIKGQAAAAWQITLVLAQVTLANFTWEHILDTFSYRHPIRKVCRGHFTICFRKYSLISWVLIPAVAAHLSLYQQTKEILISATSRSK